MSRPFFLSAAAATVAAGDLVRLHGDEGRHAATVLRLRAGELLCLIDGAGAVAGCRVVDTGHDELRLEVLDQRVEPEPLPHLSVIQAIPKGDRGALAVEMLTEIGVDRIVPWAAERSVALWRGERGAKSLAKWRATAKAATKQARRTRLPDVADPITTTGAADLLAAADLAVVLHEGATRSLASDHLGAARSIVIVVGPEGGISDAELDLLGVEHAVRLGTSVLRTSTAGVAAAAVVLARTDRWQIG